MHGGKICFPQYTLDKRVGNLFESENSFEELGERNSTKASFMKAGRLKDASTS